VVCNKVVDKNNFERFVEVWFSYFFGFWRTRLFAYFGEIVLAGRASFALRISEIEKITEHKICVSYVLMIHL
jgi:hypothetical protein